MIHVNSSQYELSWHALQLHFAYLSNKTNNMFYDPMLYYYTFYIFILLYTVTLLYKSHVALEKTKSGWLEPFENLEIYLAT